MQHDRTTLLATAIVFGTGVLWGFYWLPVRALAEMGLTGAWGTVAITAATAVALSPLAVARRKTLRRANLITLVSIALGGAAFALYSIGFVYGRVAIIILLYFLTPVWSTLIGRYVMGWHTPPLRILAIFVGLLGLGVMLGADGHAPVPKSAGEWMALAAGILWSVSTTGIRAKSNLGPVEAAFVFAVGAMIAALLFVPFLDPMPLASVGENLGPVLVIAFATGGLWWGLSVTSLLWAAVRLEPARVGILLMSEVLVGAVSAAMLAGEHLGLFEILGGALVLLAGVLEIWPARRPATARQARS